MIVGYRDRRTRDFAAGKWVKALSGVQRSAYLKLERLEAAETLRDLAALPGNRFEALSGDRKGQYSIRINDQWGSASSGQKAQQARSTSRSWTTTDGRGTWHGLRFTPASSSPKN
jgi:proteic killer suppression protein